MNLYLSMVASYSISCLLSPPHFSESTLNGRVDGDGRLSDPSPGIQKGPVRGISLKLQEEDGWLKYIICQDSTWFHNMWA